MPWDPVISNMTRKNPLPITTSVALSLAVLLAAPASAELSLISPPGADDFILCDGSNAVPIYAEPAETHAVTRAIGDLAEDIARVTGVKPVLAPDAGGAKNLVIVGTLGVSKTLDQLAADGKLDAAGMRGMAGGQAVDLAGEQPRLLRRLHAAAPGAGVAFDQHLEGQAGLAHRRRQAGRHGAAVGRG